MSLGLSHWSDLLMKDLMPAFSPLEVMSSPDMPRASSTHFFRENVKTTHGVNFFLMMYSTFYQRSELSFQDSFPLVIS
jgi:hypothetical protein